jgi:hypothetical protein
MKKAVVIILIIFTFIFLVGCIDYKAYEVSEEDADFSLLDEIALIEEELNLVDDSEELELIKEIEEEVVLPDLDTNFNEEVQVVTVDENDLVKLNVKAKDPDEDQVSYSFTPPLNQNGEWQTTYGDAGEYLVTLTATDGVLTSEKRLKIMVNRVNVAPEIGPVKDIRVKEGETVNFEPKVTDPNSDAVNVVVSEPLKSGSFLTDHTSAGEYNIKVTASDGELESEKSFKLVIEDVNVLPEISNLVNMAVDEGEVVTLEPEVTDLDGDEVTLTISQPFDENGVWETTYTDHGEYMVTVTASDGKDTVTKRVRVVVNDVNKAPEFVEVSLVVN